MISRKDVYHLLPSSHEPHTFFYDLSVVIQHAFHLTAADVGQANLGHKRLGVVEGGADGVGGTQRDQESHVMLPQAWWWYTTCLKIIIPFYSAYRKRMVCARITGINIKVKFFL